jgi:LysR family transcriptional activator of dmlA
MDNIQPSHIYNLPSLEDLRLFCTVVRNRSFSSTAAELGTSRAFVSKRIALLEQNLKVGLLYRSTRRVSVTEDGIIVFRWSQKILEDVEHMSESVTTAKTTPCGFLRICTSAGFGRIRVAPALSELASQYPSLRIQLHLLDRPIVDLVGAGFDLDIRIGGVSEPNLIVKRIAANCRVLCAAPAYLKRRGTPKNLDELTRHNCIVMRERDQSFGVWRLKGPEGMETVRVTGSLSCNNGEISHQWAVDGHGIILRSMWDVRKSIKEGRLARVLPNYVEEADISAVYPVRLKESAKVRVCVQFLEQRLKSDLSKRLS